jgi:hypothetical protein
MSFLIFLGFLFTAIASGTLIKTRRVNKTAISFAFVCRSWFSFASPRRGKEKMVAVHELPHAFRSERGAGRLSPLQQRARPPVRARRSAGKTQIVARASRERAGAQGIRSLAGRATRFRGHEGRVEEFSLVFAVELPEVRGNGIPQGFQAQGEDVQEVRGDFVLAPPPSLNGERSCGLTPNNKRRKTVLLRSL